jgi:2-polyprenyl-3-methyl-5-hydroxy-6-metoxy-1,4-benzoquinol methylase
MREITMAAHGATVVGVDISETHVRVGQEKANALGVEVTLCVGDMMNLDDDVGDFDIVYIGSGGIC